MALPSWNEHVAITEWQRDQDGKWVCAPGDTFVAEDRSSQVYHAMMLALRDYVNKNRFPGVVLGLSGGIDSALSAAVAVDALGAERVRCVMLPSRYTSRDSLEDADACALALGVSYETIEIERAVAAMGETLAPASSCNAVSSSSISIRASPMSRSRCFGSFCKHRCNKRRTRGGVEDGSSDQSGSPRITAAIMSVADSPRNAILPVSISYNTQPNAHMSAL